MVRSVWDVASWLTFQEAAEVDPNSLREGFGQLKSMESFACSVKNKPRRLDPVLRFAWQVLRLHGALPF